MNIIGFMKNIGIISKNTSNENNPALNQGQQLIKFNKMYTREITPQYTNLQSTGIPGITTIVETMSSANTTSSTNGSETSQRDVSNLEDEFNRTVSEYNSLYKIFSEERVKKTSADKDINQYYGQIITTSDGNYSYINNYGYTHKYSNDAWSANAENCPSNVTTITSDTSSKFNNGPDMGIGQACGIAGNNIRNSDTGENAWVDVKGYKHIYSSDVWASKQSACDIPVIILNAAQYNAIPSGGAMTTTDYCMQLDINPNVWNKLMQLNQRLIDLGSILSAELGNSIKDDVKITVAQDIIKKERLQKYISQLNQQQSEIALQSQSMATINGKEDTSKLENTAALMQMIAWMLLLIVIIGITVRAFLSSDSTPIMDSIGVIVAIVIFYLIVTHLK